MPYFSKMADLVTPLSFSFFSLNCLYSSSACVRRLHVNLLPFLVRVETRVG